MVSSLVIKLEPGASTSVIEELCRDDRIAVGHLQGAHLPVVLDVRSLNEGRTLTEEIELLPGVVAVSLVEAHFEPGDLEGSAAKPVAGVADA